MDPHSISLVSLPLQASSEESNPTGKCRENNGSNSQRLFRSFQTWRGLTLAGLVISCLVALANVIFLIWSVIGHQNVDGLVTLFDGDCQYVGHVNTALHLVISLFSNLLLGVSNACTQALASPTREDVDRAHRRGRWLSIGVSSLRNLPHIPLHRTLLCCVLACSSLPLSLLYNSVVIQKLSSYSYKALPVMQNFATDGPRVPKDTSIISVDPVAYVPVANTSDCCFQAWNSSGHFVWSRSDIHPEDTCANSFNVSGCQYSPAFVHYTALVDFDLPWFDAAIQQRLTAQECAQTYGSFLVPDYSNVIVVAKETNLTSTVPGSLLTADSLASGGGSTWICEGMNTVSNTLCDPSEVIKALKSGQDWQLDVDLLKPVYLSSSDSPKHTVSVDYCLAAKVTPHCELSMSPTILAIVILCNIFKISCLLWALLSLDFVPMVTVGDAIQSFLTLEDTCTKYQSSMSSLDVRNGLWNHDPTRMLPQQGSTWASRKHRWAHAVALSRWITTMIICILLLIAAIALIWPSMANGLSAGVSPLSLSLFGQPNGNFLWQTQSGSTTPLLESVILSNTPQILISLAYVCYNSVLTSMALVEEYSAFAHKRRGLRVTEPCGKQRGTYFLSLPLRYSIPFMVAMILLHWLASQAIFVVSVTALLPDGSADDSDGLNTWGWSPPAIVASVVVGAVIVIALPVLGWRRYPSGIVVAANCSAAISAACHYAGQHQDPAAAALMYGVLAEDKSWPRRVGFTPDDAEPLVPGDEYEGPSNTTSHTGYRMFVVVWKQRIREFEQNLMQFGGAKIRQWTVYPADY